MRTLRRAIVPLLLAAVCLISGPGCLGRFALTASIRQFNLNLVEAKWGREVVFVALYIIPVYPFCAFADILVINSIEFWTETNPIDGEKAITLTQGAPTRDTSERVAAARPPEGSGQP